MPGRLIQAASEHIIAVGQLVAGWIVALAAPVAPVALVALVGVFSHQTLHAQEPLPIWAEQTMSVSKGGSAGESFFRKKFTLIQPEKAELEILSGGDIELYINDRLAHRSAANQAKISLDITSYLSPNVNVLAVKARHAVSLPVGFSAKLRVKEVNESRWRILNTNDSWKVTTTATENWFRSSFDDSIWVNAKVVSQFPLSGQPIAKASTTSSPPAALPRSAKPATEPESRFSIDPEFTIEEILTPEETGSCIALEFNEFGQLLLSREGGPLLIADLKKPVGDKGRIRTYCDQVNTVQGILPLNGNVYVTGMGPEGMGLYLLSDTTRKGTIDKIKKIVGFTGGIGEHGPHGISLGPDGMLYVILGNGTQVQEEVAATSPYKNWYEGDLVPRYEDPGGHAVGVKAPGGTILRLTLDGSRVERFAGGIRNAYDLVFDENGDLIVHDSDMESDVDAPWYRPNNLYHVPAGAELGWRSGWSNFPIHAVDQTPPLCGTGRGSPTGAVLYQHIQFPARYHDTIFLADWSEGKILTLRKEPAGAGYKATTEVFLSGKPLNVCDLTVGEDGAIYFCTGGRGTSGGVFRVSWQGTVPHAMLQFESDLAKVIRHPQPNSAWGRQNIAELSKRFGPKWGSSLEGATREVRNPTKFRIRALQTLVLFGPTPSIDLLTTLAADRDPEIRAEVARIGGLNASEQSAQLLDKLLSDDNARVRRMAGEAHLRLDAHPPIESLKKLLSSTDRIEAMVGRRLLERIPPTEWEAELIKSGNTRQFINSSIALMTAEPSLERAYEVLAKCSETLEGFINDLDFLDLLRTIQLALIQGKVDPSAVPGLVERIENEFPAGNALVNRELIRIMGFLKIGDAEGRIESYLKSNSVTVNDRIHAAMHLQFIGKDLPANTRMAIIECLESARTIDTSAGLKLYLKRSIEDVAKSLTPEQVDLVLVNGARWPNAVIPAFYQLPAKPSPATLAKIIALDQQLAPYQDAVSDQLRLGVIAILARSGDPESLQYLRELWVEEEHRRNDIVIGLSLEPAKENWPYLVSSLNVLDDLTGREIVQRLLDVPRKPIEPRFFRELILLGYRMRNSGALEASKLLEFWTGEKPTSITGNWNQQMDGWRTWFVSKFPDQPTIDYDDSKPIGRHSVASLIRHLEQKGFGDPVRGKALFETVQCATCHRHGVMGESVGPDLTNLAQRFSLREMLEATIDPSANIPDRYRSKIIQTLDGDQHSGMAIEQANGEYLVLRSDGKRIRVLPGDIEAIKDSNISAMPAGLLDPLSESQVADLMAFLMDAKPQTAKANAESLR